jgi:hypothetical protein
MLLGVSSRTSVYAKAMQHGCRAMDVAVVGDDALDACKCPFCADKQMSVLYRQACSRAVSRVCIETVGIKSLTEEVSRNGAQAVNWGDPATPSYSLT